MGEELVTIDITDGVADVRLNRPEKYNALSREMFSAILDAGEKLSEAKEVRAVVYRVTEMGFVRALICLISHAWPKVQTIRVR